MHFIQILLIFSIFAIVTSKTGPSHGKYVMCPFFATSLLGSGREFNIETADFNLCTHAICSITWNRLQDPWSKQYGDKFDLTFLNLRRRFPHLQIILGIYNLPNDEEINSMFQGLFVETITDFISRFKFNGLDVNWDYTKQSSDCSPQNRNRTKQNVLHLTESLRNEFQNLSLAYSFTATEKVLLEAHDYRILSHHLNYMNFMIVDDFNAFKNKFTISDILKAKAISHLKDAVDDIVRLGQVPSEKVVMGLHFGGTEFKNLEDANNIFELINNDLDYNGFCHLLSSDTALRWSRSYDVGSSLAISRMENKKTGEIRVIVFDSSRSMANKMKFIMNSNLAGVKTSVINSDDMGGSCELDQDTYDDIYPFQSANLRDITRVDATFPLLRTINEVIIMYSPKIPKENESAYTAESNRPCMIIVIFIVFIIIIIISLVAVIRRYLK